MLFTDWTRYALVAAALAVSTPSVAQSGYPAKPIKFVVPFAVGGASDVFSRYLGLRLSERVGQSIVSENKPGAGGTLAAGEVARAPADGYTLFIADVGANAIAASLYSKLAYDPVKDFAPVHLSFSLPIVLVMNPAVPATNVRELLAYLRANPGKVNYASAGSGGISHLGGEMLKQLANVDIVHVPYKGGAPGLAAVLSDDAQMMFVSVPTALSHVRAGKLRALAAAGTRRSSTLPDVPTMAEAGVPGYSADSWGGLVAPAATPREVVTRLNREINELMKTADVRERLQSMGYEPMTGTPEEFGAFLRAETDKWAKIVRVSGARAD